MGQQDLWTPRQDYTDRHLDSIAETDALHERTVAQFDVPGTPPSLNKLGSRGNHFAWFEAKKHWEGMFYIAMIRNFIPRGIARVRASAVLWFRDGRRRDEGNYRYFLEKALGDALALQWVPDDTPEHFRFTTVDFEKQSEGPTTIIIMSFLKP